MTAESVYDVVCVKGGLKRNTERLLKLTDTEIHHVKEDEVTKRFALSSVSSVKDHGDHITLLFGDESTSYTSTRPEMDKILRDVCTRRRALADSQEQAPPDWVLSTLLAVLHRTCPHPAVVDAMESCLRGDGTGLSITATNMGTEGAAALADAFTLVPGLQKLGVQGNPIGDVGATAISQSLKHVPKLTQLVFRSCPIGDTAALAVVHALDKTRISYLWLRSDVTPSNKITVRGVHVLKADNPMTDELLAILADNTPEKRTSFARAFLKRHSPDRRDLMTPLERFYDGCSEDGVVAALRKCIGDGETALVLVGDDTGLCGATALKEAIQHVPGLEKVSLENCIIGNAGAVFLAEALCHTPHLNTLNLRANMLGDIGATALSQSLAHLPDLRRIGLRDCPVSDAGIEAIVNALLVAQSPPKLISLMLTGTHLTDGGIECLTKTCTSIPSLQSLEVNSLAAIKCRPDIEIQVQAILAQSTTQDRAPLAAGFNQSFGLDRKPVDATDAAVLERERQAELWHLGDRCGNAAVAAALKKCVKAVGTDPVCPTELVLTSSDVGNVGTAAIAVAFQHLPNLDNLDLGHTKMTDVGASAIASELVTMQSLRKLSVECAGVTMRGVCSIVALLPLCPNVVQLRTGRIETTGQSVTGILSTREQGARQSMVNAFCRTHGYEEGVLEPRVSVGTSTCLSSADSSTQIEGDLLRIRNITPEELDKIESLIATFRANDLSQVSETVASLRGIVPSLMGLNLSMTSLEQLLVDNPIETLATRNVSPILSDITPYYNIFCGCLADCTKTDLLVDSVDTVTLCRNLIGSVEKMCPIIIPSDVLSLQPADRQHVCLAMEYNRHLFNAIEASKPLLAVREDIRLCVEEYSGLDVEATVSRAIALQPQVMELHQTLLFRVTEEADMREALAELHTLPAIAKDRLHSVGDDLAVCEVSIQRRQDRREPISSKMTEDRDHLQREKNRIESVLLKGRSLMQKLSRHKRHPEAAEVLRSQPLKHPLDDTALSQFSHLCCEYPFHAFNPDAFNVGNHTLFVGRHPDSHMPVVLKEYNLSIPAEVEHARREVSVFNTVRDVHIVQFLGLVVGSGKCYVVTEKYNCNLLEFLKTKPTTTTRRHIGREVLLGLSCLEGHRVVHRDIKPQNILINHADGVVTAVALADFDISKNPQDYLTTLDKTGAGTMDFLDPTSRQSGEFDSLSDVYSFGRTMQVLFASQDNPLAALLHGTEVTTADLSSHDVTIINRCMNASKSERMSAYYMAASGLFVSREKSAAPSGEANARLQRILASVWQQVQRVRPDAEAVPCTVDSLLTHFALPEAPSIAGYCRVTVQGNDDEEASPLRAMLTVLQDPVLIGGEQIALLEAGDGDFLLVPSIDACTVMQECVMTVDRDALERLETLKLYFRGLGRFLAFQLLEGPLPHGLLGLAVYAAMRGNINGWLQDPVVVSRVFASTFPVQRRSLLKLLASGAAIPFNSIPGSQELDERVLDPHNEGDFAAHFEYSYVRLMMEAGIEIHRGYTSLHPDWAEAAVALTLDQFLEASAALSPFSMHQYMGAFTIANDSLREAFEAFVKSQVTLHNDNLLRMLLVFACGCPMLPQTKVTLELASGAARLALPSAHQCTSTITVPDTCLQRLDMAFQDSCEAAGITLGTGDRSRARVEEDLNRELSRFRILSDEYRTCPSCGVAVERTQGCNRMSCTCGKHFCWACGYVSANKTSVYRHMVEKHGGY
ncbi:hypothetical protein KIPB_005258 [Kipferlia bialata]|uniref:Protein kinase domain-containing protein n=1 Tax=Kipferlia bialata TaxID=797122 RepID=A0A9K3GIE5_9EUKA|nr:hypothetical protein KIPB_005258 [Kipferlia bialata]|eukprot:g5258.t1